MKVTEMTVSTLIPTSDAMNGSVETALMAVPSRVRLMKKEISAIRTIEEKMMTIWSKVKETPPSVMACMPMSLGKYLVLGPHADHDEVLEEERGAQGADERRSLGRSRSGR